MVGAASWLLVDGERVGAECVNVSMGGASVFSEAKLALGSVVRFELSLGLDRGSVAIPCEVVRANNGEAGLRFIALDRPALEAIVSLI